VKSCPACHGSYSDSFVHCPRDGTPLVEADLWTVGTVVRGKYQILSKIGEGGMGAVYKALHLRFKELRALKVMSPELMKSPVFLKRFEHEAILTRKLQHPNAVRVEDFDEAEDGRPFIVMEYVEGRSLKQAIAHDGPLPVLRTCAMAKQIASALDAAHRLGMIHRDIKPENIALVAQGPLSGAAAFSVQGSDPSTVLLSPVEGPQGQRADPGLREVVKVLDFGIAKIKEGLLETTNIGMTLTGTGVAVGTPAYMSPEQAMGKKGDELDGRSDIYSLGVVMYQMLTGELPLKADTPIQMMMAHVQTRPRPIKEAKRGAHIPDAIAGLVMRCLEKSPDRRPASGRALIEEIEYWEDEPARLVRAKAEQERVAGERAEAKRAELQKAEEERRLREMAEALAKLKAERELRASEEAKSERTARHGEEGAKPPVAPPLGATELLNDGVAPALRPAPRRSMGTTASEVRPAPPWVATDTPEATKPLEPLAQIRGRSLRRLTVAAAAASAVALGAVAWYFLAVANKPIVEPPGPSSGVRTSVDESRPPESPAASTPVPPKTEPEKPSAPKPDTRLPARNPPPPAKAAAASPQAGEGDSGAVPQRPQPGVMVLRKTTVDPKAIKEELTLGRFYYDQGEYDNAMAECDKGLKLDPSNADLQKLLSKIKNAKTTETNQGVPGH